MEVALLSVGIGTLLTVGILSGIRRTAKEARTRILKPLILGYSYRNAPALLSTAGSRAHHDAGTLVSIATQRDYPVHLRAEAVFELGRYGDHDALVHLLGFLNSSEPQMRKAAADGIWALARRDVIEPPLHRLLMITRCDEDPEVRRTAVAAMETCGRMAVHHLITLLDDNHVPVRIEARKTLGRLGDLTAAVPLIARLSAGSYEERRAAVNALGNMRAAEAVPYLIRILETNSADAPIVRDAARALAVIGDKKAIQYVEWAMLKQLVTSEKPHKDLLFSYRKLLRNSSPSNSQAVLEA
jgi:HEAT repeat protein